jgi:hypothetical protein
MRALLKASCLRFGEILFSNVGCEATDVQAEMFPATFATQMANGMCVWEIKNVVFLFQRFDVI